MGTGLLTINCTGTERSYQITLAVESAHLSFFRYCFENLYGDRFAFVGEGASEPAREGGVSLADELEKLGELRRSGVLTAEEFEAAKARLLS